MPYVAAWSAEAATDVASADLITRTDLATGRVQLRYLDERPEDRDGHGVLWHRVAELQGRGEPLFTQLHTVRQRRVMSLGLCQVCAAPASAWMTTEAMWEEHCAILGRSRPFQIFDPPVCLECAERARRFCPAIGGGHVFLAPRAWAITSVRGPVLDPLHERFGEVGTLQFPAFGAVSRTDVGLMLAKALGVNLFAVDAHRDPVSAGGLGQRLDIAGSPARRRQ